MRYVCIDIETLGLSIQAPIIQVAAVFVDNHVITGQFETLVKYRAYNNCEPYAMSMHPELLRRLAKATDDEAVPIEYLAKRMLQWFKQVEFNPMFPTVFAGKNVGTFDIPRLDHHTKSEFSRWIKADYRYLDPGNMFVRRGDARVPSLDEILKREGMPGAVDHTALADALATVAAIERGLDGRV